MLLELSVQNLLLIEDARLELVGGLNVITGETGAGKTVLAHALDLLLGGRARPGIVRPGAGEAYVEGVFELPAGFVSEHLAADACELVLARRVGVDGRTRAYLGGRSIPVGELRELAAEMLSFYGQHEHRRLMLATAQLEILDGSCGPEQVLRRTACAAAWAAVRDARGSSSGSPSSPERASASWICSSSSSARSSRSIPVRTSARRSSRSATACATSSACAAPPGVPSRRWPTKIPAACGRCSPASRASTRRLRTTASWPRWRSAHRRSRLRDTIC